MTDYRLLAAARVEFAEAAHFYDIHLPGLGDDFVDHVTAGIERIRSNPNVGAPIRDNLRRLLLTRFPFLIIYALEGDGIVIIAIAHQKRRPGYWLDRTIE